MLNKLTSVQKNPFCQNVFSLQLVVMQRYRLKVALFTITATV